MNTPLLLDQYMPDYQFHEEHSILIQATPQTVFAAIQEMTPAELSPLVSLMFKLRALPGRLLGKSSILQDAFSDTQPFLQQMLSEQFMLLAKEQDREIVFGMVGQFWKITPHTTPVATPIEFIQFKQTEYAKVAANLMVTLDVTGKIRCSTITRVQTPDRATQRKFAFYWGIISMGSAIIRLLWLRAIKRRAEKSGAGV